MLTKILTEPQLKFTDSGSGTFEGYAATYGNVDRGGDVIHRGAFSDAIPGFLRDGFIAIGHDWKTAVAYPTAAVEDDHGLYIRAAFHSTTLAQDARTTMRERLSQGKSVSLSIGYDLPSDGYKADRDGLRHLHKIFPLFETSIVTVPMNPLALLTGAKGEGMVGFGLPWEEHTDDVLEMLAEWVTRCQRGTDIRLKEGRPIQERRRLRLAAVRDGLRGHADELDALLIETEPKPREEAGAVADGLTEPPKAAPAPEPPPVEPVITPAAPSDLLRIYEQFKTDAAYYARLSHPA